MRVRSLYVVGVRNRYCIGDCYFVPGGCVAGTYRWAPAVLSVFSFALSFDRSMLGLIALVQQQSLVMFILTTTTLLVAIEGLLVSAFSDRAKFGQVYVGVDRLGATGESYHVHPLHSCVCICWMLLVSELWQLRANFF